MQSNTSQTNKIVNVTLSGGILGSLADSPKNALNRTIKRENSDGWSVVQIIPSASGNLFLIILRVVILLLTLFLYTPANGYYIVMKRKNGTNNSEETIDPTSTNIEVANNNDLFK